MIFLVEKTKNSKFASDPDCAEPREPNVGRRHSTALGGFLEKVRPCLNPCPAISVSSSLNLFFFTSFFGQAFIQASHKARTVLNNNFFDTHSECGPISNWRVYTDLESRGKSQNNQEFKENFQILEFPTFAFLLFCQGSLLTEISMNPELSQTILSAQILGFTYLQ